MKIDWIVLAVVCTLVVLLIASVGAVVAINMPDNDPYQDTSANVSGETTLPEETTAGEETTGTEDTTLPDGTQETTVPEQDQEQTDPTESTGGGQTPTDPQKPTTGSTGQGSGTTDGPSVEVGFTDNPQLPTTGDTQTTTPPVVTTPPDGDDVVEEITPPTGVVPPDPSKPVSEYTLAEYKALTPAQQKAFFAQFPSLKAFNQWYNAAKAADDANKLVIGDNSIDLGELMGSK